MFTKAELEYMNSTPVWKNSIEFVSSEKMNPIYNNFDSYVIYKKKKEPRYLAIHTKMLITDELSISLENKTMQELHNNRIGQA